MIGGGVDGRMSCWNAMKNNYSMSVWCIYNKRSTQHIICAAISDEPVTPLPMYRHIGQMPVAPLPPQELLSYVWDLEFFLEFHPNYLRIRLS